MSIVLDLPLWIPLVWISAKENVNNRVLKQPFENQNVTVDTLTDQIAERQKIGSTQISESEEKYILAQFLHNVTDPKKKTKKDLWEKATEFKYEGYKTWLQYFHEGGKGKDEYLNLVIDEFINIILTKL